MSLLARLIRGARSLQVSAGARSPQGHGSGIILNEQIPGSETLILAIRVVLEVRETVGTYKLTLSIPSANKTKMNRSKRLSDGLTLRERIDPEERSRETATRAT